MKKEFCFEGFDPDDSVKVLAQRRYDLLYNIVPADAVPVLSVKKRGESYSGVGEVVSSQGTFKVSAEGSGPSQVIDEIYEHLQGQLKDWKKVRFL